MARTPRWMIAGALLLLVGCEADSQSAAPEPTTDSTLLPPSAPTVATSPDATSAPRETSNPDVVSRRTTTDDVAVDLADRGRFIEGYERSAVPVDAWPASLLTVNGELFDLENEEPIPLTGAVLVSAEFVACEVIAVWALPQPDQVAVGYEEHPGVDCDAPNDVVATFSIPRSGLNSEGDWDYVTDPPVELLRRVGQIVDG